MVGFKRTADSDTAPTAELRLTNDLESVLTLQKKKSKKTNVVYSQPADTGSGTHVLTQIVSIIDFLKSVDDPQSISSINKACKVDIEKNRDLHDKLRSNEKITFDEQNITFAYKPTYPIRNNEDLLSLLKKHKDQGGMEFKDLKDSYSKLDAVVDDLDQSGKILVIKKKDDIPRILFWNDAEYNTPVDSEFKIMWAETKVPDEADLPRELEKAGLKTMEVFEKKISTEPKQKKSKGRYRKLKLTNTHLVGIDLSTDYVGSK